MRTLVTHIRAVRVLRRSMIGVLAAISLTVPALASATEFSGAADDPRGDPIADVWSIPAQSYIPINPDTGGRAMDLTRAEVYYDDVGGALRITYIGKLPVGSHQGTGFSGRIAAACGTSSFGDISFSGYTGSDSGGIARHGAARFEGPSLPFGGLTGFVYWGAEGVTFGYSGSVLARHDLRCVTDLQATWIDSQNDRNRDGIVPFCLVAGCLDVPLPPALELSSPTLNATSFPPGATVRAAAELKNTNLATVPVVDALITARPPGSTHANGPIKYDFPNRRDFSLGHGDVWVSAESFTLPLNAPLGRYDIYITYKTADGLYHDGPASFFDVSADGAPLPFPEPLAPTVNVTVTNTSTAAALVIDNRCTILPGKIKATTARMKLLQRASHRGTRAHRSAAIRQVRVLAVRRESYRTTLGNLVCHL